MRTCVALLFQQGRTACELAINRGFNEIVELLDPKGETYFRCQTTGTGIAHKG